MLLESVSDLPSCPNEQHVDLRASPTVRRVGYCQRANAAALTFMWGAHYPQYYYSCSNSAATCTQCFFPLKLQETIQLLDNISVAPKVPMASWHCVEGQQE